MLTGIRGFDWGASNYANEQYDTLQISTTNNYLSWWEIQGDKATQIKADFNDN